MQMKKSVSWLQESRIILTASMKYVRTLETIMAQRSALIHQVVLNHKTAIQKFHHTQTRMTQKEFRVLVLTTKVFERDLLDAFIPFYRWVVGNLRGSFPVLLINYKATKYSFDIKLILQIQLLITLGIIAIFIFHEPTKQFASEHPKLLWIPLVGSIPILCLL